MSVPPYSRLVKFIRSVCQLTFCLAISCSLLSCAEISTTETTPANILTNTSSTEAACQVTEAVWAMAPDDSAVLNPPAYGYYYINEDRSIWASAWWSKNDEFFLRSGNEGNKIGWFRPAGADLEITGQRLDGEAPPLDAHIPCCYPTRFQATGLMFPTEGCWEVTAKAEDKLLTFIVQVHLP